MIHVYKEAFPSISPDIVQGRILLTNILTCVGAVSLLDVKELPVEVVDLEIPDELAHGRESLRPLVDQHANWVPAVVGVARVYLFLVLPSAMRDTRFALSVDCLAFPTTF